MIIKVNIQTIEDKEIDVDLEIWQQHTGPYWLKEFFTCNKCGILFSSEKYDEDIVVIHHPDHDCENISFCKPCFDKLTQVSDPTKHFIDWFVEYKPLEHYCTATLEFYNDWCEQISFYRISSTPFLTDMKENVQNLLEIMDDELEDYLYFSDIKRKLDYFIGKQNETIK